MAIRKGFVAVLAGVLAGVFAGLFVAGTAHGASVYINSDQAVIDSATQVAGMARFRFANSGVDQILQSGVVFTEASSISTDLGSGSDIVGVDFRLTLLHLPGQGFAYTIENIARGTSTSLNWGTFTTPRSGVTRSALDGRAPARSFNGLLLVAYSGLQGSSLQFDELDFTSLTLAIADGQLFGGVVAASGSGGSLTPASARQRIVGVEDLSLHQWQLSARFSGVRGSGPGGDNGLQLDILAAQFDVVTPVPSTAATTLLGVSGAAVLLRRARSTN